jgi:HEAT repeat protein
MKHIRIALLLGSLTLSVVPAALVAQDLDFYTQQFDSAVTIQDQFGIVRSVAEEGSGADEFYAHALDRLLSEYPNISASAVSERRTADDMVKLLCQQLGEAEYTGAGPNLWRAVENFFDPLVKAEALRALGKVQAIDLLPQVVQLLTDINNAPSEDRLNQEQIAFGAVESLEAYKDSSGYLPVFFAATGWYSDRVKQRARQALPNIMDNPTDPLVSVIKSSSYNNSIKYAALEVLEASDVTAQQKASGAVASLAEIWRASTNLVGQRSILTSNRKLALSMIRRYGTEDTNVYPFLERCYKEGTDEEEQIAALAALSALATDDSARRLSSFLADMNERLRRGTLTREDERMVRVIIPALGNTGRPLARVALRSVLNLDWTGAVQRLAQDALKKIQ